MSEEVDVIILGAGLTGLTVARGLKLESSLSFLVLEARDRLGGRVHSVQAEGGPVVEMGATWFFPSFRNLFKLLRELKVELGEQYMKGHIMHETSREAAPSKVSPDSSETRGDRFAVSEFLHWGRGGPVQDQGRHGGAGEEAD